jgi:hypothetical protein
VNEVMNTGKSAAQMEGEYRIGLLHQQQEYEAIKKVERDRNKKLGKRARKRRAAARRRAGTRSGG